MADQAKQTLPQLDIATGINHSPHVVILGAGASRACCPGGDRNGRLLPVMSDLVVKLGIKDIISEAGYDPSGNFETIYGAISESGDRGVLDLLDEAVRDYFSALTLPDEPTLYDYLILSLRPKDLIVTFNWDPLLPQAYRRWRHLGNVLPQIAFLHGNVDVSVNMEERQVRFTSDLGPRDRAFKPSRLLYPVAVKDYNSDPFTKGQWEMSLDYMRHSYYVTVYGYSAPRTDVEARQLLLDAWQNNTTRSLAEFDVVDIAPREAVEASWAEFIVRTHGSVWDSFEHNILKLHPRRSCEAFAFATLQQTPWQEDPFPGTPTLDGLERWIKPLLVEEASGALAGDPHH